MEIASHTKCRKCGKVKAISELKMNLDGIGMLCVDTKQCKDKKKEVKK